MANQLILTDTTRPLRLQYDASNGVDFGVSAAGGLTITPKVNQPVSVVGLLTASLGFRFGAALGRIEPADGDTSTRWKFRDPTDANASIRIICNNTANAAIDAVQASDSNVAKTLVLQANGGSIMVGDSTNANMTRGVTINQGANNDEILAMKSSAVGHGITDVAETDTYGAVTKSFGGGGLQVTGLVATGASNSALKLRGVTVDAADTTKSGSGHGAVVVLGAIKSGVGLGAVGANGNLLSVENNGTTRFILDGDGDSHQDVGTAWTNFDTHDDVALLNLLSAHVSRLNDPLRATFGRWLEQSRGELERIRLVQFNEDGHHFVNMSRLAMLHTGAIRQLADRLAGLEQKLLAA